MTNFIIPTNKYFIFFDDANKALPNLDYLLQFINSREKGSTKIVITVRDYVRNDLNKYLYNVPYTEITVKPFEDEQIIEIINKTLPNNLSLDALVLERIVSLSKGNSRLAIMAVSSIMQNNDIKILNNVCSLYDQYFQKIKTDLSFLEKPEYLKALGILSFFGVLDRNNIEIREVLEQNFKVNWDELWEIFIEFEKVELVDVFYKEAAKISDQVLATYLFYKTFIDKNFAQINYSDWLVLFIVKYDRKINKTLIDLINTFGFDEMKDQMTGLILEGQRKIEKDKHNIYKFYEIFWFYRELDTLLFVRNWICNLEEEETELVEIEYNYEENNIVWTSENFKLLLNFWNHNTPFTKEAIELGLKLILRQPSRIPEILKQIKENLAFHRFDYRYGYPRQTTLISILDGKEFSVREKTIVDQLFLSIVPSFLGWQYTQIDGKGNGQMVIYDFALIKTNSLMELRKKILEKLFSLFDENEHAVLDIMYKYTMTSRNYDSSVYNEEQPMISDFLSKKLKPANYSHCKLIYEYVDTLKDHNIKLVSDWNLFLNSESMQIAKVFSTLFDDGKLKYEEQEQKRKTEIENYVTGQDISFIEEKFELLDTIYNDSIKSNDTFWIDSSLSYLFQTLAKTNSDLYYESMELIMLRKYSFELKYANIISFAIQKKYVEVKELYKHINKYEYNQKQFWKQMFFDAIEENDIDEFFLLELIGFIFSVNNRFYIYDLDNYVKFDKQFNVSKSLLPSTTSNHNNIITYIADIFLSKTESPNIIFDTHICEKCSKYFIDKIGLLKQIFYLLKKNDSHYDYKGKEMAAISYLDHYFLVDFLKETTKDANYIDFKFDSLNLNFIWDLPEFEDIYDKALDVIIEKAPIFSNFEHQANVLFKGLHLNAELLVKVLNYISKFILMHHSSIQHIQIILNVVTYNFNNEVLRFLKEALLINKDIEFVKCLWLEKNEAFWGSRVPNLDTHINFINSIVEMTKTLPNPLDYAEHIKFWEQEIEFAKKEKQFEMKRDFTGWFD